MKKASVLFISLDGLTDPLGQSQILPYLIGLSKQYEISIISSEKAVQFQRNGEKVGRLIAEHGLKWHWTPYRKAIPLISQYSNYRSLKKQALKLAEKESYSIIHCRSLIPGMIGRAVRDKEGGKLLYDMRGFWADERVEGGIWNLSNPIFALIYRYFKKQESLLFRSSDHLISLTSKAAEFIRQEINKQAAISVIPCCVDLEKFYYPREEHKLEKLREKFGIKKDQFVLLYLGSLGTRYQLNEMLSFFRHLKDEKQNAVFLIVSNTPKSFIYSHSDPLGIKRADLLIGPSESNEVPDHIALADLSIFFIKTGFTGKAVSPTKQAESLIMSVPVICNRGIGDTDRLVEENELGWVVDDYTEAGFRKLLLKIEEQEIKSHKMRTFALEHLSLPVALKEYELTYQKLLN